MHAVSFLPFFFFLSFVSTYKPCDLNILCRLLLVNIWLSDKNDRLVPLEKPSIFSYQLIGCVLLFHQSSCANTTLIPLFIC